MIRKSSIQFQLTILTFFLFGFVTLVQAQDDRRDPTTLPQDRIPGFQNNSSDSSELDPKEKSNKEIKKSESKEEPTSSISSPRHRPASMPIGFTQGANYVEARGGGSLFIGGPAVNNVNKSLQTSGFDGLYTYTYGSDAQKAAFYYGSQSYEGINVRGEHFGLMYEKGFTDHWGLGIGIDYKEYKASNVPNNALSRLFIQGTARFPGQFGAPSEDVIQRFIGYEFTGLGTFANSVDLNKIIFVEANAIYHFNNESAFDPYLKPLFGIGYESTTKSYALKVGGAAGMRYYLENGIYFGGELAAEMVYLGQERVVTAKGNSRIDDISFSLFLGKKFQ
ncbi:hypothetical protein [Leptospira sp. GIMC2001]|uniref:hypothetical protein n=1 Tax=Leptospira sp. GIMC2001 TaxID=1513297 RepID=UPI00234ACD69|nr:hypothetical protein [Leptospira sp. GIMC2001]WCL49277.1 hypothetical protein O4O04_18595 [Leptospira sp. GIMC2001]